MSRRNGDAEPLRDGSDRVARTAEATGTLEAAAIEGGWTTEALAELLSPGSEGP